jgi:diacylglycerol kinase
MSKSFVKGFGFAFEGLFRVFETQRNFRFQLIIGTLSLFLAVFLQISLFQWTVLLLCIALVLSAEIINTVIETVVDMVTTTINPKAKLAKDLSAAVVLINAMITAIVGLLIFIPHIIKFFQ